MNQHESLRLKAVVRFAFSMNIRLFFEDQSVSPCIFALPELADGLRRTMSSPAASLNTLIYNGILTLILQGFKRFFATTLHAPALTCHLHPAYLVIEEIVEGFVEGSSTELKTFTKESSENTR